jgi:outer membrane lipoprotein-sorting protein
MRPWAPLLPADITSRRRCFRSSIPRIILLAGSAFLLIPCGLVLGQTGPGSAPDHDAALQPAVLANQIAAKLMSAKQYAFEGEVQVTRKLAGDDPGQILAQAKVKVEIASGGKYRLDVGDGGKSQYLLVSDGETRWSYVPELKRYTESSAASPSGLADNEMDPLGISEPELISTLCRQAVPTFLRVTGAAEDVYNNGPILTLVTPKKSDSGSQEILYLTIDPDQVDLKRMIWMTSIASNSSKVLVRSAIVFDDLRIDQPISDSEFAFTPPKNAKRTGDLKIPSQHNPNAAKLR